MDQVPVVLFLKLSFGTASNPIYRAFGVTRNFPIGQNVVADPSFENGPARGLHPHDTPWGGEEVLSPSSLPVSRSCRVRLQMAPSSRGCEVSLAPASACPGCNESFMLQRIDVTPYTDYTFSFWLRGTTLLTSGIQIPFLDNCHNYPPPPSDPTRPDLCPDNDGEEMLNLGRHHPNYDKEFVHKD